MDKDEIDYILNILRKGTITWRGRRECLKRARKQTWDGKYTLKGKKVYKLQWQCNRCKEWYKSESMLEVDHIIEVGPFKGDWTDYISRLYCGQDNLQALCVVCHSKKTSNYNAQLNHLRKKEILSDDCDYQTPDNK